MKKFLLRIWVIINRKKIIERKSFYEIAVFRRSGGGRFDPHSMHAHK